MHALRPFSSYTYSHHRYLHSFPTRRSSDLRTWPRSASEVKGFWMMSRSPSRMRPRIAASSVCPVMNSTLRPGHTEDRKSTRLNSSHQIISYAVFCLKKKNNGGRDRTRDVS